MIPFIMLAAQYCIMSANGTSVSSQFSNLTNVNQFLQAVNGSPCLFGQSAVGFAMLALVMIIAFGVLALRFDVGVAGATAGWVSVFASLLLVQLGLLASSVIGIAFALNVLLTIVLLLKGALNPY